MASIALLAHPQSAKRRSAAKQLRKLGVPTAGPALYIALEHEMRDPRTWETQYQMIMALAACQFRSGLPLLRSLAQQPLRATMIYVALGHAIVELAHTSDHDTRPILELISSRNSMLINGAFRAMAMLRMVPDAETIKVIISTTIHVARADDLISPPAARADLRRWVAAAAAGWSGEDVERFLQDCLGVPNDALKRAAEASLQGNYLHWTPL